VAVVEGLGCKAVRVTDADDLPAAFAQAHKWMEEFRVPVVVEVILERVNQHRHGHRNRQDQRVSKSWP